MKTPIEAAARTMEAEIEWDEGTCDHIAFLAVSAYLKAIPNTCMGFCGHERCKIIRDLSAEVEKEGNGE